MQNQRLFTVPTNPSRRDVFQSRGAKWGERKTHQALNDKTYALVIQKQFSRPFWNLDAVAFGSFRRPLRTRRRRRRASSCSSKTNSAFLASISNATTSWKKRPETPKSTWSTDLRNFHSAWSRSCLRASCCRRLIGAARRDKSASKWEAISPRNWIFFSRGFFAPTEKVILSFFLRRRRRRRRLPLLSPLSSSPFFLPFLAVGRSFGGAAFPLRVAVGGSNFQRGTAPGTEGRRRRSVAKAALFSHIF